MSSRKTQICNISQALLGQPKLADFDTDTGTQANWYREIFDSVRDFALRAHPWNFAARRAILDSELVAHQTGANFQFFSAAYSPTLKLYVLLGEDDTVKATILTSPDFVTWTRRTPTVQKAVTLTWIIWSATLSLFVAVGMADGTDSYILTSPDGTTWTERAPTVAKNVDLWYVAEAPGAVNLLCAVGSSDGADAYILTSPDGITWTERDPTVAVAIGLTGLCWGATIAGSGNGLFVAVGLTTGTNPYILTSQDGLTWTARTPTVAANVSLEDVWWNGKYFIAVGHALNGAPYAIRSINGVTWTAITTMPAVNSILYAIRYGNGAWVACGDDDTTNMRSLIVSSNDNGATWTQRYVSKNLPMGDLVFINGKFIFMGAQDGTDGTLMTWDGPPAFEFTYRYALPLDCLRVYDVNGGDLKYKIEGDGMLISQASPQITYTARIENPAEWDDLFCQALGAQLAMQLCLPFTGSDGRMAAAEAQWKRRLSEARTTDSQEDGEDPERGDPWIVKRGQSL